MGRQKQRRIARIAARGCHRLARKGHGKVLHGGVFAEGGQHAPAVTAREHETWLDCLCDALVGVVFWLDREVRRLRRKDFLL